MEGVEVSRQKQRLAWGWPEGIKKKGNQKEGALRCPVEAMEWSPTLI